MSPRRQHPTRPRTRPGGAPRALLALLAALGLALALPPGAAAPADDDHDHPAADTAHEAPAAAHAEGAGHDHDEENPLAMDAERRRALGIVDEAVGPQPLADMVQAPAEVVVNTYRSAVVTPRIPAQVVARHARLGERVTAGARLVTLSSVDMARAQADLMEADREWRRVRKLGRQAVSDKRYVAAQLARQLALAAVRAYGMSEAEVQRLLAAGDARLATGRFDLLSPRAGTVIRDDFTLGELIEPGRPLFEVTDESTLWVEARLRPEQAATVTVGGTARVSRDGEHWLPGRVIQIHHRVDEATRTLPVRIAVENPGDRLHPGDYVEALVPVSPVQARIAVPEQAVVLLQGSPTVFVVEGEAIHPRPVETGRTVAGQVEIVAGLAAGERVVTRGAFLLKSLLLKSQMGEGHAH